MKLFGSENAHKKNGRPAGSSASAFYRACNICFQVICAFSGGAEAVYCLQGNEEGHRQQLPLHFLPLLMPLLSVRMSSSTESHSAIGHGKSVFSLLQRRDNGFHIQAASMAETAALSGRSLT
jgi:hypothetical protein